MRDGFVTGSHYKNKDWCKPYKFPPCSHNNEGPFEDCSKNKYDTPKCLQACSNEDYPKTYNVDKIFALSVYSLKGGEVAIQQEVFAHGPVEGSMSVYADLLMYKSGVYQYVYGDLVGSHAIKIIGWGVENGVKYWLVANSWNDTWGEKGTFKILRGVNHVGIETNIVAGLPRV